MSSYLFDSNVLLDVITRDPLWLPWSKAQLTLADSRRVALINPVIYAEIAPEFASQQALDQ